MIDIPPHIRGLVFDCDGTIADTMPLHYEAWAEAIQHHGHEFPEALFYEMAGIPTARIIELLNERHGWKIPSWACNRPGRRGWWLSMCGRCTSAILVAICRNTVNTVHSG